MAESAKPLDINTLSNWPFKYSSRSPTLPRQLHRCLIASMRQLHKKAWVGWVPCRVLISSHGRGLYYSIAYWDNIAPVGKSYSALDFQADVVVCVNGGVKIYKLLDNIEITADTWSETTYDDNSLPKIVYNFFTSHWLNFVVLILYWPFWWRRKVFIGKHRIAQWFVTPNFWK